MKKTKPVITVLGLCGRSVFLEVDHFHSSGETVHADSIHIEPGGKGYNQAVAAARLGASVNFITCCGDDDDGKVCSDFLIGEGIRPLVQKTDKASTAFASILTDRCGENQVTVYRGAADYLSADFIRMNEAVFAETDILLLNLEYPLEVNYAALELAEKYGVRTIMNPAPAGKLGRELLDRFFCITPNESEAAVIGFETTCEIITLGGNGVLVIENGKRVRIPAESISVVDTTGAGDCFNAALAVSVAKGDSLTEAAEFAQKAAAKSVSKRYVMPSLPYINELQEK